MHYPVCSILRCDPVGQCVRRFDEQEFPVVVLDLDCRVLPFVRDCAQEPDDEPLVVDGVGHVGCARKPAMLLLVARLLLGESELELLLVPDVVFGERTDEGEDLGAHVRQGCGRVVRGREVDLVRARVGLRFMRRSRRHRAVDSSERSTASLCASQVIIHSLTILLAIKVAESGRNMAALNCVMLSPAGDPVPLPHEKFLFSSRLRTVAISLFARPPGAEFSVQPKRGEEYKQNHGTLHVSQKRIVYVAAGATAAPPSGAAGSSLALGQASIAPGTSSTLSPDKVPLMTLSIPLRYFVDGHLVQPWFGANYYEALCIDADGAGDLTVSSSPFSFPTCGLIRSHPQGPHIIRLYFKEGGGYEFYTAVEEVKARAELHHHSRGRDTPVEQLRKFCPFLLFRQRSEASPLFHLPLLSASRLLFFPHAAAYTAANGEPDPSSASSSSQPPPTPSALPPPPALVPPRTAPSPADLVAAETARAAEEAERLQLASAAATSNATPAAAAGPAGAVPPPTLTPQGAGEAPPGYSA